MAATNPSLGTVEEQRIRELERERQEALVSVDLAILDRLFAEDLIHVHSTGLVHSKEQLLNHIFKKRGFLKVERGELTVRVENAVAVMTGSIVNTMRGAVQDSPIIMRGFVTQVLRRDGGIWRFTNFQLTVTNEPA